MRQTMLWRTLRRFETLKAARRRLLFLGKRVRRRLSRKADLLSSGGELYLTFDDGPDPVYSPRILDTLAKYDAKAVFFVIGSRVEAAPDVAKRMVAEGHRIGNHTWGHTPLAGVSRFEFDEEIGRTQDVVERVTGERPTTFRPPFGAMDRNTRRWTDAAGVEVVMWDLDTQDWSEPDSSAITASIVEYARSGDVVLMHDGGGNREPTIEALEGVLERLSSHGVRFPLPQV